MKITKTTWIILTIGICAIVFASLGFARAQQLKEQAQMDEEISIAENRLSSLQFEQLSSQQGELEKQLSQSIAQFEATKTILSQPVEGIAISDTLFSLAESSGAKITEISSSGLALDKLEEVPCSVLPFTIKAEGTIPSLMSFIFSLNAKFVTGTVESVEIVVPEDTAEESPSATIRLRVYTYKGD